MQRLRWYERLSKILKSTRIIFSRNIFIFDFQIFENVFLPPKISCCAFYLMIYHPVPGFTPQSINRRARKKNKNTENFRNHIFEIKHKSYAHKRDNGAFPASAYTTGIGPCYGHTTKDPIYRGFFYFFILRPFRSRFSKCNMQT